MRLVFVALAIHNFHPTLSQLYFLWQEQLLLPVHTFQPCPSPRLAEIM